MEFIYQYRTPDNKQHRASIRAASKESAYATLKAQGIKPGRVEEAPGFFNKLFGKGKRWIAIGVLTVALFWALSSLLISTKRKVPQADERSQIYGDPSIVQQCEAAGWTNLFTDCGDLFLAAYAQPGLPVSSNVIATAEVLEALKKSAGSVMRISDSDPEEIRKMKRIVNGMRRELGEYIADGGCVEGYVLRMNERQRIESRVVDNIRRDLDVIEKRGVRGDREKLIRQWNEKNVTLREMGLRTIPLPRDW